MGILAALLSAVFSSSKDIFSKRLSTSVDGTTSAFASFLFALPFYAGLLLILALLGIENFAISGPFVTFVVLRSITDTFAEWMKMCALKYGDLSLVSSILSLYPAMLIFVSPVITGDSLSLGGLGFVVLTIIGTGLIVYRPVGGSNPAYLNFRQAVILSVGSAFFMCLNTCFDRMAVQQASPSLSAFAMTFLSALLLFPVWFKQSGDWSGLISNQGSFWWRGLMEVLFMVSKLTALVYLPAPYVVGLQRSSILLNVISGRVIFKEINFVRKLCGAGLIFLGVLGIAWLELFVYSK